MQRFYWLIASALAGCSRPGGTDRHARPHTDADNAALPSASALEDDLVWLRAQGVGAILSLTEHPLEEAALARHALAWLHLPVEDLQAPSPEQLLHSLEFIDQERGQGRVVAVHCLMGQGRTGTVLAAYLIRAGSTPEDAIARLRQICPGAIGTPTQEHALQAFARRRDWIA